MSITFGQPLCGIVPPLLTPLGDNDQLDVAALEMLIEHMLGAGVHGLFVLGTTGEALNLSESLRREMVQHTCRIVAGRVPVLVGITATALSDAARFAHHAADAGADVLVTATPSYYRLNQQELMQYIEHLLPQLPLPLMLYNIPQLTGLAFTPATVDQLIHRERIIGIKDSSGDMCAVHELLKVARQRHDFSVLMGNDMLLGEAVLMGCHGGVTGGANIDPATFVAMYDAARQGDLPAVRTLQRRIETLNPLFQVGQGASANIAALKCAGRMLGLCREVLAPPFLPLNKTQQERIGAILDSLDLRAPKRQSASAVRSAI